MLVGRLDRVEIPARGQARVTHQRDLTDVPEDRSLHGRDFLYSFKEKARRSDKETNVSI